MKINTWHVEQKPNLLMKIIISLGLLLIIINLLPMLNTIGMGFIFTGLFAQWVYKWKYIKKDTLMSENES